MKPWIFIGALIFSACVATLATAGLESTILQQQAINAGVARLVETRTARVTQTAVSRVTRTATSTQTPGPRATATFSPTVSLTVVP